MAGPPLQPATTFGLVVPEPAIGIDRGHADRNSQPCTHAAQAERDTRPIETVPSTRRACCFPTVGDRPPPHAESTRMPTKHSTVAARGAHIAPIFADPTDEFCREEQLGLNGEDPPRSGDALEVVVAAVDQCLA